ncbi:MAG: InlB B-repeat-containing protein [Lachnospiraceae bacterium]|nr:InlB B-repeat-containing protein [Lachnospiraceae bacterium]
MKIGRKCREMFKRKTALAVVLSVILTGALCLGGVLIIKGAYATQRAATPTAKIVAYADKSTSGLRVGQMLEVQTSNFSDNAKLKYEYSWSNGWALFPYTTFSSPDTAYYSYAYGDYRYVAISVSKPSKEKLTVKVTDTNTNSSTYGKTATASYKNFKTADLSKDLSAGSYGMFVGESEDLLHLLGKGGVLHITCDNSSTESCTVKLGSSVSLSGTGNDTTINAVAVGEARCMVKVKKNDKCAFHSGQSGSGEIIVYVFDKPTATSVYSDSILLRNTEAGVTYTVNGVSKKCTTAGEEIMFDNLEPETKYKIECSKVISGKKVSATFNKTTNGKVTVKYDKNEKGTVQPSSQTLYAGDYLKVPGESVTPSEPGYMMMGWCETKSCSTKEWDFAKDRVPYAMTLYAKWVYVPNAFTVTLNKDDQPWKGQSVALYQGDDKKFDLTDDNGIYSNDNIANGKYDIYVNGEKTGQTVIFDTTGTTIDSGQKKSQTLDYYTVSLETYRNDVIDGSVGEITLRQNGVLRNTVKNIDGKPEVYILNAAENNVYEVYIGDEYTQRTITAKPNATTEVYYYYDVELALTYSTAWTDAKVTLRDDKGAVKHTLEHVKTEGNTCYYRKLALTEGVHYNIYVGIQDSGEDVELIPGEDIISKAAATFYRATVEMYEDNLIKTNASITLSNGEDNCRLNYDASSGKYIGDIPYKEKNGEELVYDVLVRNAQDENPAKISLANPNATVRFYSVNCHVTISGADVVSTVYVRENNVMIAPASPTSNGLLLEEWYTSSSYTELFDFSKAITEPIHIYGKFEAQKATINNYIKTDSEGMMSSTGEYYRMANLTISGYPNGDVMHGFILDVTGCIDITMKVDDSLGEFTISPEDYITATTEENITVTTDNGKIIVQFTEGITMKELQKFIRNNVIVKPDSSKEHTMTVTVFGDAN